MSAGFCPVRPPRLDDGGIWPSCIQQAGHEGDHTDGVARWGTWGASFGPRPTSPAERDPQALADAERIVTAWLDDDEALRIPDTPWGRSLYDAIRTLADLSARPAATTDAAAQATVTEWGTLDRWYDEPEVQSYGTEEERPDGQDYARLDAERFGDDVVVVRREVTAWVKADPGPRTIRDAMRNVDDLGVAIDPGTRTAHHDTGHHGEGA